MRATFRWLLRVSEPQSAKSMAQSVSTTIFPFIYFFLFFSSTFVNHLASLDHLSARANTFGGIVKPICFAAFRLMMNSNLVGCSTGSSAGLAPFRILST